MSLRARILLLFVGFALLPVVLLGAGDYVQSVQALRAVVEARGEGLATQAASEIEREYSEATSNLRSVAEQVALQRAAGSGTELTGAPPEPFAEIFLRSPGSAPRTLLAAAGDPMEAGECPGEPAVVRVTTDIPATSRAPAEELEGVIPISRVVEGAPTMAGRFGQSGFSRIIDRETGKALYTSDCARAGTALVPDLDVLQAMLQQRTVPYRGPQGDLWRVSTALAAGPDWVVTFHSNDEEFVAPFRQSRLLYLGLALLILSAAALLFAVLAQNSFRSLRALAVAADAVRLGHLKPWLPPPADDEVGRLTLAFRKMMDRLEESIRQSELNQKMAAVGELASYLSHEIRNPLSSIRLSLQSLRRSTSRGSFPDDAPRILEIALSEVKRLDGVVRTVLEMGRPTARGRAGACSVHDTVADALQVLGPKLTARGVAVELDQGADPDRAFCDPESLRGVWMNLLVNALDALEGRDEGRIRITTWTDRDAGEVVVRVADNGPGVPPGLARSIFEPFFTTKQRGNGIGLPMAARVIQQWGGAITYEPVAAGPGAAFLVRLQLTASDVPAGRAPSAGDAAGPHSVLTAAR